LDIQDLIIQINSFYGKDNLLYLFILAFVISYSLIIFWRSNVFLSKFAHDYKGEQRVHLGEISRMGGLMMFASILIFYHLIDESINANYTYLLYMISPFMLVSFIEDTFHNVSFKLRLFFMVITALTINLYWFEAYPVIENIPILSHLLEFPLIATVFFSLALIGLMNGANFIDGMNGLATLFFLGAICGCITLSMVSNYHKDLLTLIPWAVLLICFLIFNFPFGKFFLGDSGAYLMAILLGVWLIDFFSRNQDISSWNAVLILIYPIMEVAYSTVRKIYQGKSPFFPDRQHIHIKIYDIVFTATKKPLYANNITTMFLAIFWLAPALMIQFVYFSQGAIMICILMIFLSYLVLNIYTPSLQNPLSSLTKN